MAEQLTCTKMVKINLPPDEQGRKWFYHQRCGQPGAEVEIGGLLTKAKAILCVKHRLKADKEAYISSNGYPLGKIKKSEKAISSSAYLEPEFLRSGAPTSKNGISCLRGFAVQTGGR